MLNKSSFFPLRIPRESILRLNQFYCEIGTFSTLLVPTKPKYWENSSKKKNSKSHSQYQNDKKVINTSNNNSKEYLTLDSTRDLISSLTKKIHNSNPNKSLITTQSNTCDNQLYHKELSSDWNVCIHKFFGKGGCEKIDHLDARLLRKVAWKAVKLQTYDSDFWRHISRRLNQLLDSSTPLDLSLCLNSIKQMRICDEELFLNAAEIILQRINEFNIHDLSVICITYSSLKLINQDDKSTNCLGPTFLLHIADYICGEGMTLHSPPKSYVSWVHLVTAFANCNTPHEELFKLSAKFIKQAFNEHLHRIPGMFLFNVIVSFARFNYRHDGLFKAALNCIPGIYLTDEELVTLYRAFSKMNYEDETMKKLVIFRGKNFLLKTEQT